MTSSGPEPAGSDAQADPGPSASVDEGEPSLHDVRAVLADHGSRGGEERSAADDESSSSGPLPGPLDGQLGAGAIRSGAALDASARGAAARSGTSHGSRGRARSRASPIDVLRSYGWTGPRTAGYFFLVVLLAACVALGMSLVAKYREAGLTAAREAAGYHYTSPRPVVAVVGDTATFGAGADIAHGSEWPALLRATLHVRVLPLVSAGAGYVTRPSGSSSTFATQAARIPRSSRVVVFFGGGNDQGTPSLTLATAVTKSLAAAAGAPAAAIVVVGPLSPSPQPSSSLLAVRDTLRSAAKGMNVEWVDPIGEKWLMGGAGLIGPGGHPTKEGQQALERDLRPVLDRLL